MKKKRILCIALGVMLIASVSLFGQRNDVPDEPASANPVNLNGIRVMCLGDSITEDNNVTKDPRPIDERHAYRSYLYWKLVDWDYYDAFDNVNFVGTCNNGSAMENQYGEGFDINHEGHAGWYISDFLVTQSGQSKMNIHRFLDEGQPEIVLLHIGTNGKNWSAKPGQLITLLDEIDKWESTAGNHPVWVFLSTIIQRNPWDASTDDYNMALWTDVFFDRYEKEDKFVLVPMDYEANLQPGDYFNKLHPNDSGYEKMAQVWYDALVNCLIVIDFENINYGMDIPCRLDPIIADEWEVTLTLPEYTDPAGYYVFDYWVPGKGWYYPGETVTINNSTTIEAFWWRQ